MAKRIKLQVGKKYLTANGRIATVLTQDGRHLDVRVRSANGHKVSAGKSWGTSDSWYYTPSGKFVCEERNRSFPLHIVAEKV